MAYINVKRKHTTYTRDDTAPQNTQPTNALLKNQTANIHEVAIFSFDNDSGFLEGLKFQEQHLTFHEKIVFHPIFFIHSFIHWMDVGIIFVAGWIGETIKPPPPYEKKRTCNFKYSTNGVKICSQCSRNGV